MGGHHQLKQYLSPVLLSEKGFHLDHTTEYILMGSSVGLAAILIVFALMKYSKNPELNEPAGAGKILANKWYIDELYDTIIVKPLLVFSTGLKNIVEKNIIDGTVNNVGKLVQYSARQIRLVQSGLVGNYIMIMVLAIVVFILMWFYDASIVKWVGKLFN